VVSYLPSGGVLPCLDHGEAIFLQVLTSFGSLLIEWAVPEQVVVFMAFSAPERDVFIVKGL
jgi:hypothetical protein